jgi:hypothetical protein
MTKRRNKPPLSSALKGATGAVAAPAPSPQTALLTAAAIRQMPRDERMRTGSPGDGGGGLRAPHPQENADEIHTDQTLPE